MRNLLLDLERMRVGGAVVGRAVVTGTTGSAPRRPGAAMLATEGGETAGSVAGGCVEAAVAHEIAAAIRRGSPHLVTYGLSDELGFSVGLACGGTLDVFVEPQVREPLVDLIRDQSCGVLATVVGGDFAVGACALVREDGSLGATLPPPGVAAQAADAAVRAFEASLPAIRDAALAALRREESSTAWFDAERAPGPQPNRDFASREVPHGEDRAPGGGRLCVFLEVIARPRRLVVVGATHVAAALVPMARMLGFRAYVADARPALLTRERFPDADELLLAWPDEAFARLRLDRTAYVCVLAHDPKFDKPALVAALRSDAAYVGLIGSRPTQELRRQSLREAGLTEREIARLHGPIGLDLGGRDPAETALAVLAEITAVRHGRSGRPLGV